MISFSLFSKVRPFSLICVKSVDALCLRGIFGVEQINFFSSISSNDCMDMIVRHRVLIRVS